MTLSLMIPFCAIEDACTQFAKAICAIKGACTYLHAHYTRPRQQFANMSMPASAVLVCFWTSSLTRRHSACMPALFVLLTIPCHVCSILRQAVRLSQLIMCMLQQPDLLSVAAQAVAQLEAETQQVFQENQQLNKQSNLLNTDVGCCP